MTEEQELYEPTRKLLRSRGYRAVITHGKANVKIWIGDIFPYKEHVEPDVVGVTRSWTDTVCVEAKAELAGKEVFDVLGKCMVWRLIARNVYLAMPEQKGLKTNGFRSLGIGLITVSEAGEPREAVAPSGYMEQDNVKSQELYNQALRAVTSEYGVLEIDYASATSTSKGWKVPIAMKNIGSQPVKVLGILLAGKSYEAYQCQFEPEAIQRSIPFEVPVNSEREVTLLIPKNTSLENKSLQIDLPIEDGIEKGFSVYLSI